MKKLSEKQWLRHIRIMRRRLRKARTRKAQAAGSEKAQEARARFQSTRSSLPAAKLEYDRRAGYASFIPPKVFSLSENFEETMAFLMDYKAYFARRGPLLCPDGKKRRMYAEFGDIEKIAPGAGLVLAAEIHRFAESRSGKIKVDDEQWNEGVRNFFIDAGLFDLLKIDPKSIKTRKGISEERETLQYISGRAFHSTGQEVHKLRNRLEELAGQPVGERLRVYNAIAEALANVIHAYPPGFRSYPYATSKRWWTSGFWEPSSKTVGLQLYDEGAGIPSTLPRQLHWPRIVGLLDKERRDSGLIAAAMEYGRTSTGKQGRGKGLAEMAEWIETSGTGFLRILSGRGEVTYRPGSKISKRDLHVAFDGTLVQWEVSLV